MSDKLMEAMKVALSEISYAEELAYAGGMASTIGTSLIAAHSPLLKAINDYRAMERRRAAMTALTDALDAAQAREPLPVLDGAGDE